MPSPTNAGTNVSKAVGFVALQLSPGVNVSKAIAYVALKLSPGTNVSKAVAYVALLTGSAPPLTWPTTGLPNGVVGVAYSASIDLFPASGPITFTMNSGSLPPGLSLSSSGTVMTISGTPTTAGTYTFTVNATNAFGSAVSQTMSITIVNATGPAATVGYGFVC